MYDSQHGHGTPCPYDCKSNVCAKSQRATPSSLKFLKTTFVGLLSDEGVARNSYKINVSFITVGDGFSAKTATLLSLCDISPNRGISLTSLCINCETIYTLHYSEQSSPLQFKNLLVEALDKLQYSLLKMYNYNKYYI